MTRVQSQLTFTLSLVLFAANGASAQFSHLTSRVPSEANALVLIDVTKLHNSPLAKTEGWAGRQEKMFESGLLMVPPNSTKLVTSAKLDMTSMKPDWELTVMDLDYEPSMPKVALRYRGTVDNIQNREVAVLPGSVYAVKLNKGSVAVGFPANRQDVGRWMNRIYSNVPMTHSPYLEEAKKFADEGTPMIMALDLTHALSAADIRQRLGEFEAVKGKKIDLDAAAKALSSIRGITLGVAVTDRRGGSVKVDFSEDISVIKDIAKPLLLEVLGRRGATISDFYNWEVAVGEKEIRLRGELSQSGSRRILSLLAMPPSLQNYEPPATDDQQSSAKLVVYASQNYFKSVNSLIEDLRDQKGNRQTMGQLSMWFDKYARRIDRLPLLNVDKELLAYGTYVSNTFRGGTSSVTKAAATSRIEQSQVPEQYDVHSYSVPIGVTSSYYGGAHAWGWNGWTATPDNLARGRIQSQIRTEQNIRGSVSANVVLQEVDKATANIRQYLTGKYKVEF